MRITYPQITALMNPYRRASERTYTALNRLGLLGTTTLRAELIDYLRPIYYRSHMHAECVRAANKFLKSKLEPCCPDYTYTIDLNERGLFQAHVSDCSDKVVWEYSHDPDAENPELDLVTDGFVKHVEDVDGLEKYLKSIGVLPENAVLRME
jgi:hypothetical protein